MNVTTFLRTGRIFRYRGKHWAHRVPPQGEWCFSLGTSAGYHREECTLLYLDYQGKVQQHVLARGSMAFDNPEPNFDVLDDCERT